MLKIYIYGRVLWNKEYRCEDEYNIPYSSFGLIWRDLGLQYIEEFGLEEDEAYRVFKSIDYRLVRSIDADDDAIFCYSGRFLAAAETFSGAIKLAKLALKK